ncbi:MAG: hypothetical protein RLZZ383_580, partial [Pseudomonadota bacterium]
MKLTGRILHLVEDRAQLRAQLDGQPLDKAPQTDGGAPAYVYGVNTDDMISGKACTFGYTGEILGPWFLETFRDVVRQGE